MKRGRLRNLYMVNCAGSVPPEFSLAQPASAHRGQPKQAEPFVREQCAPVGGQGHRGIGVNPIGQLPLIMVSFKFFLSTNFEGLASVLITKRGEREKC